MAILASEERGGVRGFHLGGGVGPAGSHDLVGGFGESLLLLEFFNTIPARFAFRHGRSRRQRGETPACFWRFGERVFEQVAPPAVEVPNPEWSRDPSSPETDTRRQDRETRGPGMTTRLYVCFWLTFCASWSPFKSGRSCWILICRSCFLRLLTRFSRIYSSIATSMRFLDPNDMVPFTPCHEQFAGFSIPFARSVVSK